MTPVPTAAELHDVTAPTPNSPTGHPLAFLFFFWGEFAERCSYYGMRAILALYMTDRLGVDKGDAATFMSLFIAACYFFPLAGGWIADKFLGKYWTIVLFSVPYVAAQFLVGIENRYIVFGALMLLAMGSGVIKPNISTLMGLTYDQQRPGQEQLRTSAFSWFYWAINLGAALSQTAMPILRTKYGYQVAFLFPAGLMALALFLFAIGKRHYARESIVRKVVLGPGESAPVDGKTVSGIPVHYEVVTPEEQAADRMLKRQILSRIGALFLTVMFFWAIFDQSASTWVFFADTYMNCTLFGYPMPADSIQAFNGYFILLLVPISVVFFKAYPVKATTKIAIGFALTALSMGIMAGAGFMAGKAQKAVKLTLPEGVLILPAGPADLSKVSDKRVEFGGVWIDSTDWKYDADKKKLEFTTGTVRTATSGLFSVANGHGVQLPANEDLQKMGVLEPLLKSGDDLKDVKSDPAKAIIESVDWVKPAERVTVWWKVLAFFIITIAEILVSITGLELAFVAAPSSMKGFLTGCWLAVVGFANLFINAPVSQLYPTMPPGFYFGMLGAAMAMILVVYFPIAARFNRLMAEQKQ